MSKKLSITIGRKSGSGGSEIGKRIAEILGYKFVDTDFITLAAQKSGYDKNYIEGIDERSSRKSLLYTLAMGSSMYGVPHSSYHFTLPPNDNLFIVQSEIIRTLAEQEPCVFIGRCADYILNEAPGRISIFLYSSLEDCINHVCSRHEISREEAKESIQKTDKRRMDYYNFYTGKKWGKMENYDLAIDTSLLGIEGTADFISEFIKKSGK